MLAALLLNLGGQQPQPKPRFGGGPFTSRYGYPPEYYDQGTSSALPATAEPLSRGEPSPLPSKEGSRTLAVAPINYRLVEIKVHESVAKDLRRLKKIEEDDDEEMEAIILFMSQ